MKMLSPLQTTAQDRFHEALLDGRLLDDVYTKLLNAQSDSEQLNEELVREAMEELFLGLRTNRLRATDSEWAEYVSRCLHHPLKELVHADPFTYRAFSKPRGYAGDAELLDYIYGREERWPLPPNVSALGRLIFDYTTSAPAAAGVRARREFIANLLDHLVEEVSRPHVLSLAAGHLREGLLCAAIKRKRFGRFVALDADGESLEEVQRCYSFYGVEVVPATFRQMLTGKVQLGQFDLIYSTGLFDYLSESVAQQLTWSMFQMLRPRGRLVVANFLPGIRDVGYMESYMGWQLIYRTRREMLEVTNRIPEAAIHDIRLFSEENRNILFLQITAR
jgi:extracellular factor (EF) 3-hydroxypalmitic acid methyl ester biosynthesis protein